MSPSAGIAAGLALGGCGVSARAVVGDYRLGDAGPCIRTAAHVEGVERFLASYRSIPSTAAVRLAKPTSNLFRDRAKLSTPD